MSSRPIVLSVGSHWVTTAIGRSRWLASSTARTEVGLPTRIGPAGFGNKKPRLRGSNGISKLLGRLARLAGNRAPSAGAVEDEVEGSHSPCEVSDALI